VFTRALHFALVFFCISYIFVNAQSTILHNFIGTSQYKPFGMAIANVGDLDRDGHADIAIGAHQSSPVFPSSGAVIVFSGKSGNVLRAYLGDAMGDSFGFSVSNAGDVDRDGTDDLIIGAIGTLFHGGFARVISGARGSILYTFQTTQLGEQFGSCVSGAGDVNKDGYPDLLVGAKYGGTNNTGYFCLFSGANGKLLLRVNGTSHHQVYGGFVDGIGDVDGDGYADFIIGSPYSDLNGQDSGMAQIFSGRTHQVISTLVGDDAGDLFGISVCGLGDVDGDQVPDVAVGATYDENVLRECGSVRVVSCKQCTTLYTVYGRGSGYHLGYSTSSISDVDGDSVPDLIVGVPASDNNAMRGGEVIVLSGKTGKTVASLFGSTAGGMLGYHVSNAGDVDKDGREDIAVGIPGEGTSGKVVVFSVQSKLSMEVVDGRDFVDPLQMRISSDPKVLDASGRGESRQGAAADGVSRLLLRVTTSGATTVSFQITTTGPGVGYVYEPGKVSTIVAPVVTVSSNKNPTGKYRAYCVYRAPEDFVRPGYGDEQKSKRSVKIHITAGNGYEDLEIIIKRPPVVLCHGVWSGPTTWKNQFEHLARNDVRFTTYVVDYENTSSQSYDTNSRAVHLAIHGGGRSNVGTLDQMRNSGYAATQVDWVGHSMGGILPRYYCEQRMAANSWRCGSNYGQGDIHKLIILNSPNWGSPWANVLLGIPTPQWVKSLKWMQWLYGGAANDLAEGSRALGWIGETPIRSYALVGIGGEKVILATGVTLDIAAKLMPPSPWKVVIKGLGWFTNATTLLVYRNNKHDLVVLEGSQTAGLDMKNFGTTFDSGLKYNHMSVTNDNDYHAKVVDLLNASVNTFAPKLPAPVLAPPLVLGGISTRFMTNDIGFAKPAPTTNLTPGGTVEVEVKGVGTYVPATVDIFFEGEYVTLTSSPFTHTFNVPITASGTMTLAAFAADSSKKVAMATPLTLKVVLPTTTTLTRLWSKWQYHRLRHPLDEVQLNVIGTYSDNVDRNLTAAATGTTYSVDPVGIVSVCPDGRIAVVTQGKATVMAQNGTHKFPFDVEVAFNPVTNYGINVKGTGSIAPLINTGGQTPALGNANFKIEITNVVGGTAGVAVLSFKPLKVDFLGGQLLVDPGTGFFMSVVTNGIPGKAGDGVATIPVGVPSHPALEGFTTYWQAGFFDSKAPYGWSLTNGLAVTVTK